MTTELSELRGGFFVRNERMNQEAAQRLCATIEHDVPYAEVKPIAVRNGEYWVLNLKNPGAACWNDRNYAELKHVRVYGPGHWRYLLRSKLRFPPHGALRPLPAGYNEHELLLETERLLVFPGATDTMPEYSVFVRWRDDDEQEYWADLATEDDTEFREAYLWSTVYELCDLLTQNRQERIS